MWGLFAQSAPYSDPVLIAKHADAVLKEFKKRFRKTPWQSETVPETVNVYENKL